MGIVVARPVVELVTLKSGILAKIAPGAGAPARWVFAAVLFHKIGPPVEDRVRCKVAEI